MDFMDLFYITNLRDLWKVGSVYKQELIPWTEIGLGGKTEFSLILRFPLFPGNQLSRKHAVQIF